MFESKQKEQLNISIHMHILQYQQLNQIPESYKLVSVWMKFLFGLSVQDFHEETSRLGHLEILRLVCVILYL